MGAPFGHPKDRQRESASVSRSVKNVSLKMVSFEKRKGPILPLLLALAATQEQDTLHCELE